MCIEEDPNTTTAGHSDRSGCHHQIDVTGELRGVGFRPFVARIASSLGITGAVWETTTGVRLIASGYSTMLDALEQRLLSEAPAGARIDSIDRARTNAPAESSTRFAIIDRGLSHRRPVEPLANVLVMPSVAERSVEMRNVATTT